NFSVLLRRDGQTQLVYKHAISTVMPAHPIDLSAVREAFAANDRKPKLLQEIFLTAVQKSSDAVTMFLSTVSCCRATLPHSTCSACCCSAMVLCSWSTSTRFPPSSHCMRSTCRAKMSR